MFPELGDILDCGECGLPAKVTDVWFWSSDPGPFTAHWETCCFNRHIRHDYARY